MSSRSKRAHSRISDRTLRGPQRGSGAPAPSRPTPQQSDHGPHATLPHKSQDHGPSQEGPPRAGSDHDALVVVVVPTRECISVPHGPAFVWGALPPLRAPHPLLPADGACASRVLWPDRLGDDQDRSKGSRLPQVAVNRARGQQRSGVAAGAGPSRCKLRRASPSRSISTLRGRTLDSPRPRARPQSRPAPPHGAAVPHALGPTGGAPKRRRWTRRLPPVPPDRRPLRPPAPRRQAAVRRRVPRPISSIHGGQIHLSAHDDQQQSHAWGARRCERAAPVRLQPAGAVGVARPSPQRPYRRSSNVPSPRGARARQTGQAVTTGARTGRWLSPSC